MWEEREDVERERRGAIETARPRRARCASPAGYAASGARAALGARPGPTRRNRSRRQPEDRGFIQLDARRRETQVDLAASRLDDCEKSPYAHGRARRAVAALPARMEGLGEHEQQASRRGPRTRIRPGRLRARWPRRWAPAQRDGTPTTAVSAGSIAASASRLCARDAARDERARNGFGSGSYCPRISTNEAPAAAALGLEVVESPRRSETAVAADQARRGRSGALPQGSGRCRRRSAGCACRSRW